MSHRQSLHVGTLANCRAEQQRRLLAHPPKLSFNQFVVFVASQQPKPQPASAPSPLRQPQRRTHNYTPWVVVDDQSFDAEPPQRGGWWASWLL